MNKIIVVAFVVTALGCATTKQDNLRITADSCEKLFIELKLQPPSESYDAEKALKGVLL
jgi:hypothetical protein